MVTTAASLSTVSRFHRRVARHLAAGIAEGVVCSEAVVRHCFALARQELDIAPPLADDPCVDEIETCFVQHVLSLMARHQRFIVGMPLPIAEVFIAELLFDKSW